ncbi:hypothetical protein SAMN04487820_104219 [Actinopolyspora mzabensis]|uniref:Uncharacterized protein n=1 Tax=Actinopolyspora mzabensis TaxID=995066 RepID=A0A1G8Z3Y1_ACTMZ|nr:hypothetical protein SAMN04487820_104219 [Actinopolyspora mzabensis]
MLPDTIQPILKPYRKYRPGLAPAPRPLFPPASGFAAFPELVPPVVKTAHLSKPHRMNLGTKRQGVLRKVD